MISIQDRARAYIAPIQSISGSGGHTALFKAALALAKGYNLPEDEALALLREWNETNASPPWSESDLVHKIREAAKSDRPAGYLLTKDNGHQFHKAPPPIAWGGPAKTAIKRLVIPALTKGTDMQLREVATLRGISPFVVWLASNKGYLRFTSHEGHGCYVMTEGELVQLRRMDGQPFTKADGTTFKSKNLPGSRGTWLGYSMLERYPAAPVIIVEGLVAWMEAADAADRAECRQWIPFASLSATVKLGGRELSLLAGRRVIIAMDADETGVAGALDRQAALAAIGVTATLWIPPDGCKDLGEALALPSFNPTTIFNQS